MRTCLLMAGLLLMLVVGSGCVIIDVDEMHACRLAAAESAASPACGIDAEGRPGPAGYPRE